jgi:formylmethanofuran dehydrogenase subunit E
MTSGAGQAGEESDIPWEGKMTDDCLNLDACLAAAKAVHGDVCAGLTIGTRMAIAGLRAVGIEEPKGRDKKNLIVFVEIDRCATDAIMAITGCQPGKRTMKIMDYGKMAATFLNLKTGEARRLVVKEKEEKGGQPQQDDKGSNVEVYMTLPDEKLFDVQTVHAYIAPEDLPGAPLRVVRCERCGERVMDMRDEQKDGNTLCRPCARGTSYYSMVRAGE